MDYKISVIVPVYNAEKTIDNAIASVMNQTIGFENIELILIDDHSSDNSKKIIESYASKYQNISPIFLNENHGSPSYGRNEGIKNASADYIMFLDNDDEYVPIICEKLYEGIENNDVDIVSCRNCNMTPEGIVIHTKKYVTFGNKKKVFIDNENLLKFDNFSVWNKIFKKNVIEKFNIYFPQSRNEDYYFCCKYFIHSKRLMHLEFYGYKWIHRDGSLSKGFTYNQTLNLIKTYLELYEYLVENNKNPNLFFNRRIREALFVSLCYPQIFDAGNDKKNLIFDEYVNFEKLLFQGVHFNIFLRIGKWFLFNRYYSISRIYIKFLYNLHQSNILQKVYSKIV